MTAIEIHDLVLEVNGYPIINGLSLTVEEGERVGIVGPPGSGAEFLLKMLCGQLLPTSGAIWIYNEPPRRALERGFIQLLTLSEQTHLTPHAFLPTPILLADFTPFLSFPTPKCQTILFATTQSIENFYEFIEKFYRFRLVEMEGEKHE